MIPLRSTSLLAFLLATIPACGSVAVPPGTSTPAPAALSPETDTALRAAIVGPARTDRERARDVYRHPVATLAFFGLRDDMNVVELWPGGGYYTSILAPVLAGRGKLAVTHFDPAGDPKAEDTEEAQAILSRLSRGPEVFGKVEHRQIAIASLSFGPDGSADMVVTFRNVHNWIDEGYADKVFAAASRVLKPGGILGVEEHRAKPGTTLQQMKDTGYVPEDTVVALAESAGLRLAGALRDQREPEGHQGLPQGRLVAAAEPGGQGGRSREVARHRGERPDDAAVREAVGTVFRPSTPAPLASAPPGAACTPPAGRPACARPGGRPRPRPGRRRGATRSTPRARPRSRGWSEG